MLTQLWLWLHGSCHTRFISFIAIRCSRSVGRSTTHCFLSLAGLFSRWKHCVEPYEVQCIYRWVSARKTQLCLSCTDPLIWDLKLVITLSADTLAPKGPTPPVEQYWLQKLDMLSIKICWLSSCYHCPVIRQGLSKYLLKYQEIMQKIARHGRDQTCDVSVALLMNLNSVLYWYA